MAALPCPQWELDLHGLHAREALEVGTVLCHRTHLECSLCGPPRAATAATARTSAFCLFRAQSSRHGAFANGWFDNGLYANDYATRCVQALARRLQSLQASVNAAAAQANGYGKLATHASKGKIAAPGGGAAAPPGPSVAGNGPLEGAALLAKRRVLRVIVGKGLHSSGGEASLPRCVVRVYARKPCEVHCLSARLPGPIGALGFGDALVRLE